MRSALNHQLQVDFSTRDPRTAEILKTINEFPPNTSCRLELEAELFSFLHTKSVREAEQLKAAEQEREKRSKSRGNS